MLKVSTRSTYAIRALIYLARYGQEKAIRLSDISDNESIPLPYLEQIFSKLKKSGIVQAVRGPQGGFRLSRNANEITLTDIITVLEGPMQPFLCSMPEKKSSNCRDVEGCASRIPCAELDAAITGVLNKHTIGAMSQEAERLNQIRFVNR